MIKKPSTLKRIMYAIIMIGIIVSIVAASLYGIKTLFFIGSIISFSGIIFGLIFVRCEFCKHLLPLRGIIPHYCPYCGERTD